MKEGIPYNLKSSCLSCLSCSLKPPGLRRKLHQRETQEVLWRCGEPERPILLLWIPSWGHQLGSFYITSSPCFKTVESPRLFLLALWEPLRILPSCLFSYRKKEKLWLHRFMKLVSRKTERAVWKLSAVDLCFLTSKAAIWATWDHVAFELNTITCCREEFKSRSLLLSVLLFLRPHQPFLQALYCCLHPFNLHTSLTQGFQGHFFVCGEGCDWHQGVLRSGDKLRWYSLSSFHLPMIQALLVTGMSSGKLGFKPWAIGILLYWN